MRVGRSWRAFGLLFLLQGVSGCAAAPTFGELSRMSQNMTDKMDTHGFTEIYEHVFYPLRPLPIRICEIGISRGGSLVVWQKYFPKSTVFGIDIYDLKQLRVVLREAGVDKDFLPSAPESPRLKTFVANQTDRAQLQQFIDKYGGDFDIIMDDGGHTMEQQQVSFAFFFKHVKPGRYYVIEDVHTSLIERYQGYGADKDGANTTLTMISGFISQGIIKSRYMLPEEVEYMNQNIDYCNLFSRANDAHSITCIIKKKAGE